MTPSTLPPPKRPSSALLGQATTWGADLLAFTEAWWRLASVYFDLRHSPVPVLLVRYQRHERFNRKAEARHEEPSRSTSMAVIERSHRAVRRAANRHLVPNQCLLRSLALLQMLAARGIETELVVGAQLPEQAALAAHAWLTHNGQPIGELPTVAEDFPPLEPVR